MSAWGQVWWKVWLSTLAISAIFIILALAFICFCLVQAQKEKAQLLLQQRKGQR